MPLIIALSFCCMLAAGAVGANLASFSDIGFIVAAVAAMVFFAAMDAWESGET
jgi:hypothetical protein